jgi:PRTRC genetic system protein E
MFIELMPLLKIRSLTLTVASLDGEQIRVNVVPHSRPEDGKANDSIKYNHKTEVAAIPEASIKALTTPLSITGRAEEIDEQLVSVLSRYVESHAGLQQSFDRASTEISEAVKAIDDRNKSKTKEKACANSKKDEKTAKTESSSKPDQSLPLWWTDPSAVAPGAARPTELNKGSAASEQPIPQSQNMDVP